MSINKERNGTYTVRWRETEPLTGVVKNRKKRGFSTKREAKDFEDIIAENKTTHTFRALMTEYLSSLKGYANDETIHEKLRMYEMYCPNLLDKDIRKITAKVIQSWKNTIHELPLSITTKNHIIRAVRSLSKFGYVNYDYPDFAKSVKAFPKSSEDIKEMHIMSPQDFDKLIDNVKNPLYRAFFIFLYHTGCRRGEAMALYKADIKAKHAELNKSIRNLKSSNSRMKNAQSKRTILLDDYVLETIQPLMEIEGEYLFGGTAPLTPTTIRKYFLRACKEANLEGYRIHDLRHSFISNAILNGMNIVMVSKYVGHKNVTTTLNQYSHLLEKSEDEFIEKMSRIYK